MAIADDFADIARRVYELSHGPRPQPTDNAERSLPCGVPPPPSQIPCTKSPIPPPGCHAVHCKACNLDFAVPGKTPFPANCPMCGAPCG